MGKANNIGITISLSGIQKFKSDVTSCNKSLSAMKSEVKLTSKTWEGQENTLSALQAKHKALANVLDATQKKEEATSKTLNYAKERYTAIGTSLDTYKQRLQAAKDKLKEMEESGTATNDELDKQRDEVEKLSRSVESSEKSYQKAGNTVSEWEAKLNNAKVETLDATKAVEDNAKYMKEAEESADGTAHSIDEYGKKVKEASDNTDNFGESVGDAAVKIGKLEAVKTVVSSINELTQTFGKISDDVFEMGSSFDTQMSKVKAISGATEEEFQQLSAFAKEMGTSTEFSASQAAEGMVYLSTAGWDAQQQIAGLPGMLNLAAAGGIELGKSADYVAGNLAAFNMSADEAGKLADVMAAAQANSKTTVDQLAEAYGSSATNMTQYGQSLETTTALLEGMASVNDTGSAAGTRLNAVISQMIAKMRDGAIEIGNTRVAVQDSNGDMRDMVDIIADIEQATNGMGDAEKAAALQVTFNRTSLSGLNEMLSVGSTKLKGYRSDLQQSTGAASKMADTMLDNFGGDVKLMESAWEGFTQTIWHSSKGVARKGVQGLTNVVNDMSKALEKAPPIVQDIVGVTAVALKGAEKVGPVVQQSISLYSSLKEIKTLSALATQLQTTATTAQTAATVAEAGATEVAAAAQTGLNAAMEANPVGIVVAGVTALVGILAALAIAAGDGDDKCAQMATTARNAAQEAEDLAESVNGTIESAHTSIESAKVDSLVSANVITELQNLADKSDKSAEDIDRMNVLVAQANQQFPDLGLAVDKTTGALNKSNQELEDYVKNIKNAAIVDAYKDSLDEMYKSLVDATQQEMEHEKALEEAKEAQAANAEEIEKVQDLLGKSTDGIIKYNDTWLNGVDVLGQLNDDSRTYQDTIDSLTESIDKDKEAVDTASEEYNSLTSEMLEVQEAMNGATEATDANTAAKDANTESAKASIYVAGQEMEAFNGLSSSQQELALQVTEAVQSMQGNVQEYLSSSGRMFQEFVDTSSVSTTDLLNNMQSQVAGVQQWEENITALMSTTKETSEGVAVSLDENVVQYLANMGPEGAAYVQAFVNMSGDELAQANSLWSQKMDIESFTNTAGQQLSTGIAEWAAGGAEALASLATELGADAESAGGDVVQGLVNGITNAQDQANTAGVKLGETTIDGTDEGAGVHSPSWKSKQTGGFVVQGLAVGIRQSIGSIAAPAARQLGNTTVTTLRASISYGSLYSIGHSIDEGLASGIYGGASSVINATASVVSSAIATAKSKLEINSPSHVFQRFGAGTIEGYVKGVDDNASKAKRSIYNALDFKLANKGISYSGSQGNGMNAGMLSAAFSNALQNLNMSMRINDREVGRYLASKGVMTNGR